MPYTYVTVSRNGREYRERILASLDEQPMDNETKEGIYRSSRLVEKQRLEDAKLLEQYDKDCKNTPAYRALQKAKERAAEQYDARINELKSRYRRNSEGECFIEKQMERCELPKAEALGLLVSRQSFFHVMRACFPRTHPLRVEVHNSNPGRGKTGSNRHSTGEKSAPNAGHQTRIMTQAQQVPHHPKTMKNAHSAKKDEKQQTRR